MYTGSQEAPTGTPRSWKHTFHHAGLPSGPPLCIYSSPCASQHVTSDPEVQRRHCESPLGKQMARRQGFPCAKGSDLCFLGFLSWKGHRVFPPNPRASPRAKILQDYEVLSSPNSATTLTYPGLTPNTGTFRTQHRCSVLSWSVSCFQCF